MAIKALRAALPRLLFLYYLVTVTYYKVHAKYYIHRSGSENRQLVALSGKTYVIFRGFDSGQGDARLGFIWNEKINSRLQKLRTIVSIYPFRYQIISS